MKNIFLTDNTVIEGSDERACLAVQRRLWEAGSAVTLLGDEIRSQELTIFNKALCRKSTEEADAQKYVGYRVGNFVGVIRAKVPRCELEDEFAAAYPKDDKGTSEDVYEDVVISIRSRFDDQGNQCFLNYMLAKAFGLNNKIFKEMKLEVSPDRHFDALLAVIFACQLKAALKKGIFRQYKRFEYNDSKLKGTLDLPRHIKLNFMNNGKIAYANRQYTADNYVTCLILQAFDKVSRRYPKLFQPPLFDQTAEINMLKHACVGYRDVKRQTLLAKTARKLTNPIYANYESLRKTSIIILKSLGQNIFSESSQQSVGVLVAVDKLWELFLAKTIFSGIDGVLTQENQPILDGKRTVTPDFLIKERAVFDAKYSMPWSKTVGEKEWHGVRDAVFQIVAYAMIFGGLKICGAVFPYKSTSSDEDAPMYYYDYPLSAYCEDTIFYQIPFRIPPGSEDFYEKMEEDTEALAAAIKKLIEDNQDSTAEH